MIRIKYAVRSDRGRRRRNNEDNFFCKGAMLDKDSENPYKLSGKTHSPNVFAVFDGIGGETNGELASFIAAKVLSERCSVLKKKGFDDYDRFVDEYVQETNRRIKSLSTPSSRMGTTMAMLIVSDKFLKVYNIGDSRIYFLEDNRLTRVSVDHTLAAEKISSGIATEEQIKATNEWGKLTACMGIECGNGLYSEPSRSPEKTIDGRTRVLLCSDGVTDMLDDSCIETILCKSRDVGEAAALLMSEALNAGGKDNVTVMLLDISK